MYCTPPVVKFRQKKKRKIALIHALTLVYRNIGVSEHSRANFPLVQKINCLVQKSFVTFLLLMVAGVRADSVAVDWLGRNLYWIDGVNSQIFAVQLGSPASSRPDFTVILDEDLDQPRSLALLPQQGSV